MADFERKLSWRFGAGIAGAALLLAGCAPIMMPPPAPLPNYGWYFAPPAPLPSVDAHPADHVVYGVIDAPDDDPPVVQKIAPDHPHEIARRHHGAATREARISPPPAPVARPPAADVNDCVGWWRICHFL